MMEKKRLYFVVDDDPVIRALLSARLSSEEVLVKSFDSGEGCVSSLMKKPDLIILDYIFSGIQTLYETGMQVFEKIKEVDPDIPVIMLSGQEDGGIVLEFARKGMTDYVIKDRDLIENLKKSIAELFENRQ